MLAESSAKAPGDFFFRLADFIAWCTPCGDIFGGTTIFHNSSDTDCALQQGQRHWPRLTNCIPPSALSYLKLCTSQTNLMLADTSTEAPGSFFVWLWDFTAWCTLSGDSFGGSTV